MITSAKENYIRTYVCVRIYHYYNYITIRHLLFIDIRNYEFHTLLKVGSCISFNDTIIMYVAGLLHCHKLMLRMYTQLKIVAVVTSKGVTFRPKLLQKKSFWSENNSFGY